jgi:hypothetical protein
VTYQRVVSRGGFIKFEVLQRGVGFKMILVEEIMQGIADGCIR